MSAGPHFVGNDDLRSWLGGHAELSGVVRSIGRHPVGADYLEDTLGLPFHLEFLVRQLVADRPHATMDDLASIPFFSLCKGLFLPLSSLAPERVAAVFGFAGAPILDTASREALLLDFLARNVGLTLIQKLGCVLGDPFRGEPSRFQRDSLVRLLLQVELKTRREMLDRLTQVGDVSVLFAEARPKLRSEPALTAAEVLETLRYMARPGVPRGLQFELLRSVLLRCGKLEAFFLARLLLKRGFGFEWQSGLVARVLAQHFSASADAIQHAMVLTDAFRVIAVLESEGEAGLRRIQLQPLVPVRPALASGTTKDLAAFPVWVERKYDGIRFMLHKSTDRNGSVLCGAYTRNRRDWLELVAGLDASIRALPARSVILDGELYGTVLDGDGVRPANVYEVYGALQGEKQKPVNLKFAAFDIVYLEGRDVTSVPLHQRRKLVEAVVAPVAGYPLPVPMQVAEGQLANGVEDVNRLYGHFRAQGYEGLITKDLAGTYKLSERDPTWLKRKPEITLDLVLLAGIFAVTEKTRAGMFGSYVIGARAADGSFVDVGDVAGVDVVKDREIQAEILREGLITGRRIERKSASGVRPGIEFRPHIVVTVRFEGIVKDPTATGEEGGQAIGLRSGSELKLRDPKIVAMRPDKSAGETDNVKELEALYLRQSIG